MALPEPVSNTADQEKFLRAIFGDHKGVIFIGTLDREQQKRAAEIRKQNPQAKPKSGWTDEPFQYPSELNQAIQHALQADLLGMEAYVAAQLYKNIYDGRTKPNVKLCPVAWSDLDTAHPDRVQPEPSIVVETSPGRFHGYWLTEQAMEPAHAEALSKRLAYAHHAEGADLGGWDLTQVLRIPGTHNHKYENAPDVTVWRFDATPLAFSAFDALPEAPSVPPRGSAAPDGSEPPVPLSDEDLALWEAQSVPDRSAWAMRMVAILKEHGLSDRLVELSLANHPIYLEKAREKWGNRESVIFEDIRRCIHHWKTHPGIYWQWSNSTQNSTQSNNLASILNTNSTQFSTQWSYPIVSIGSYIDSAPEEDDPIIDGLVWAGRTHWCFSSPGSGKTLLLIGAGMHMAAGAPFCGRHVQQGGVLLLEEDSPKSVIADYARMLFDIYGVDPHTVPFWINEKRGLKITNWDWVARAVAAVESCPELPQMVIVDTCERVVPSESFNSKELEPLAGFLTWCLERGIAVIVIDHTRKLPPVIRNQDAPKPDPIDLLYGGRSKSGIADVMLYFTGNYTTGLRGEFCKFRGEAPPPIDVKFTADAGFSVLDKPVRNLSENEHKVTKWLNNNSPEMWRSARDILDATGISARTGERVLSGLVRKRWLLRRGETKGAEYRVNTAVPGVFG